jgi:hypothetical protein
VVKADPSSEILLTGVLDRHFRTTYVAALLVGNQLVQRGSKNQLRTETSRVSIKGAIVNADGFEFTVNGTGFVDPGSGNEPGYGLAAATLVPPNVGAPGGAPVLVKVRVFGETLGGEEIESSELTFPVSVCDGCLVRYPIEADNPANPGYDCTSTEGNPEEPCYFGQDDPIDCRLCGGDPICLAP